MEISPLFALDSEELAEKIPAGTRIDKPTYFADDETGTKNGQNNGNLALLGSSSSVAFRS